MLQIPIKHKLYPAFYQFDYSSYNYILKIFLKQISCGNKSCIKLMLKGMMMIKKLVYQTKVRQKCIND